VVDAIPTTGPARTLLDLAGVLPAQRVERVLDNCLSTSMTEVNALAALLDEVGRRGRPGTALLRRLVEERSDEGYVPPASELEARFLALVTSSGLPQPIRQLWAETPELPWAASTLPIPSSGC
jgi:hypothetical protein